MFESRFFVDKLIDMGKKIMLCDHIERLLHGAFSLKKRLQCHHQTFVRVSSIAALSGKGTSTIQNIEQIDRGYENR
jgi:UDP-N-acetylglucosamine 1-carboxyvinyltransferase